MVEGIIRKELGDFCSIICLKAIVTGLEDIMGVQAARGNLILAGRKRGKVVACDLNLSNTDKPLEEWSLLVKKALGKTGTRLCLLENITQNGDEFTFDLLETICSAGEDQGSARKLTFTLGAIQGVLEEITGKKFKATQTGSVLRGQNFDSIQFIAR